MIHGVELIPLVTHLDERGYFREILKSNQLPKFGQWSMSYMHTSVIKAFHIHSRQIDYWFVPGGTIKAVLCDLRPIEEVDQKYFSGWKPFGSYIKKDDFDGDEYILGDNQKPQVLVIPPGVAHGLKVLQGPAILMYITSEEYNPQDEGRIPYNSLGYDWFKQEIK